MSAGNKFDAIIVGGGSDALVAATVLAQAGRRVLQLVDEQNMVGLTKLVGIASGFSAPLRLDADWIPPSVARAFDLTNLELADVPFPTSVALTGGGFLSLSGRTGEAAEAIKKHSTRDAERWVPFTRTMRELSGFLEALYQTPPPDLDTTALGDLPALLSLGRSFRSLGKANMSELLRVLPMPAQDLADEWFTSEPLKAAIGAAAVRDIRQGPRSGGTSFVLLHYLTGAADGTIRGRPWSRSGGAGHGTMISKAQEQAAKHGVTVRGAPDTGRVVIRNDVVVGVALPNGEEISAPMVLSTLDPSRTLLHMVDPVWLDPEFLLAVKNIKYRGCTAMVYYALDGLPEFAGLADSRALAGIVTLSPSIDGIERSYDAAKYGAISDHPHIELTVPTLRWPSLAPDGKHVLAAKVHYAPHTLRDGRWDDDQSQALGDVVTAAIERVAPAFGSMIRERLVLAPKDLEDRYGLTDGAVTGGEMTLDQILFMRPVAGWGQYATPVRGLYLGGPGTHPGPGVFGMSGLLAARRMLADSKKQR